MLQRLIWLGGTISFPLIFLLAGLQQFHLLSAQTITTAISNSIVVDAVLYDGYEYGDADEAVALRNISNLEVNLTGWILGDGDVTATEFPPGTLLLPGESIWVAKNEGAFTRQFGFLPDITLAPWPGFANGGDEVILQNSQNHVVDLLVYGSGNTDHFAWQGTAVLPYTAGGLFAKEGQILYRKRDQKSGLPVSDTDGAEDWAQSRKDAINGRRVRYPAWDLTEFQRSVRVTETSTLTIAIAPDNALETLVDMIDRAQDTVYIEALTIENIAIAESLETAARRGVSVKLLLEGSPVGGLAPQEKYICQGIEEAGGQCWFMVRDDELRIHDRYRYLHATRAVKHRQSLRAGTLAPHHYL